MPGLQVTMLEDQRESMLPDSLGYAWIKEGGPSCCLGKEGSVGGQRNLCERGIPLACDFGGSKAARKGALIMSIPTTD